MAQKVLIDTNIAIGYVGNRLSLLAMDNLDKIFESEYHLSVVNKIELLGYPNLDKSEKDKFNLLINHGLIHQLDDKRIDLRTKHKIKLPDAIIAATCLVNGLDLLTLNLKDFENIEDLNVLHPELI